ncbi:MAG: hypothetical protein OCC49_17550 [Fibrobacterales bacterium]
MKLIILIILLFILSGCISDSNENNTNVSSNSCDNCTELTNSSEATYSSSSENNQQSDCYTKEQALEDCDYHMGCMNADVIGAESNGSHSIKCICAGDVEGNTINRSDSGILNCF